MKAAELIIERINETIVATSVYNSKLIYFLSLLCEEIRWVKKMKRVWAPEKDCTCKLEFLCLSLADNYNGSMGDTDISDQK